MRPQCAGGILTSEMALLSMLEGDKFNKRPVLSTSEQKNYEIKELVSEIGISKASSRLGLSKSSLKRALSPPSPPAESYDESYPSGISRRYLERNLGKWKVIDFNPKSRTACLETSSGVRISVDIPVQFT